MTILALTTLSLCGCSNNACENGRPYIVFEGTTAADRSIIEVKEYEAGKGWQQLKRLFYTGDSVTGNATDSIRVSNILLATSSYYTFRFIHSNSVCSLYNMEYHPHRHRRLLIGGEVKACINGFSYTVNGKNYSLPYEENLSYSSSTHGFMLRIPKD